MQVRAATSFSQRARLIRCSCFPHQGKKNKVSTSRQTWVATNTLTKAAFLLTVLSERPEHHNLAFRVGMFALELQRPPASTKALEVSGFVRACLAPPSLWRPGGLSPLVRTGEAVIPGVRGGCTAQEDPSGAQ